MDSFASHCSFAGSWSISASGSGSWDDSAPYVSHPSSGNASVNACSIGYAASTWVDNWQQNDLVKKEMLIDLNYQCNVVSINHQYHIVPCTVPNIKE